MLPIPQGFFVFSFVSFTNVKALRLKHEFMTFLCMIQSRSGRNGYQLEITLTSTHKIVENCILAPFNMCHFSLKALNKKVLWVNIDKEAINESYLSLHIPTSSFPCQIMPELIIFQSAF